MRGKIEYLVIIAITAFGIWVTSSATYSYWRASGTLEDNDTLFNETDTLIQSLRNAVTPLETCEILSKVYGYDVTDCLSNNLYLNFTP